MLQRALNETIWIKFIGAAIFPDFPRNVWCDFIYLVNQRHLLVYWRCNWFEQDWIITPWRNINKKLQCYYIVRFSDFFARNISRWFLHITAELESFLIRRIEKYWSHPTKKLMSMNVAASMDRTGFINHINQRLRMQSVNKNYWSRTDYGIDNNAAAIQ